MPFVPFRRAAEVALRAGSKGNVPGADQGLGQMSSSPGPVPLMPRSHQTFRLVPTMKLLGIMFKNRCWPTIFYTISAGDADGWCLNWPGMINPSHLLHCSVFLSAPAWEFFLVENQCDNTQSNLQIIQAGITFIIPKVINGVHLHVKGAQWLK
jgi:hypothetical protein